MSCHLAAEDVLYVVDVEVVEEDRSRGKVVSELKGVVYLARCTVQSQAKASVSV